MRGGLVFGFLASLLWAQTALRFEVATIKPAAPDAPINRVVPTSPGALRFK
ncbi:MAG TPA: hypothetical protein VG297_25060 [Bryobacteraceae bacterium]|jgi:hypothetical protein|nr:hypothetical protein [Bryobacteraceae bacterium]